MYYSIISQWYWDEGSRLCKNMHTFDKIALIMQIWLLCKYQVLHWLPAY